MIKKIIVIILFVFFLTGCTVEYNINIDKDLIIDEDIVIKEKTDVIRTQNLDANNFLDKKIDYYKNDNNYSMYIYEKYTDDLETYVTAKTYYLDFLSYKRNNIVKENLFKEFNFTNTNNIYTFIYKVKNKEDVDVFKEDLVYTNLVDEIKINISLPFRVINSNADSYNVDNNTYTWTYNKNGSMKDINIEFDINKTSVKKETVGIYFILGLISILLLIAGYAHYKYRKNNKI